MMKKFGKFVSAFGIAALCSLSAIANQSNTWSPTTGTVSGLQLTTNYNNAFSAIQSCNSGSAAPTNDQTGAAVKGQCWLNTNVTPRSVNMFDGTSWIVLGYMDDVNHQWIDNNAGGAGTIASSGTTDLCLTGGNNVWNPVVSITGVTTITAFGSTCLTGAIKYLNFTGILTLTHNASSLILPNGGLNVTTAVGDTAIAEALGSGNWRVISYQAASGAALSANANITSSISFTGVISPAALSAGNNNDYNPASLSTSETLRLTANASGSTLTGLQGGSTGRQIVIENITAAANITITAQDTNSAAANRFALNAPLILSPSQQAIFRYDGTSSLWRLGSPQRAAPVQADFKNLKIVNDSGAPTTTMDITADELVVEDINGNAVRLTTVSVAPVMTSSGANGLDTGAIVNNTITFYTEWVIFNPTSNTVAGLYSASQTLGTITLPAGYTFGARVGWARTDGAATARWMRQLQLGRDAQYVVTAATNTTAYPTLASGASGTFNTTTFTGTSTAIANSSGAGALVPPTASKARIVLTTGNSATLGVAPNNNFAGTTTTNTPPLFISALAASVNGEMLLESANVFYAATGAAALAQVIGWTDNL